MKMYSLPALILLILMKSSRADPLTMVGVPMGGFNLTLNDTVGAIWTRIQEDPANAENSLFAYYSKEVQNLRDLKINVRNGMERTFKSLARERIAINWRNLDTEVTRIDLHFYIVMDYYFKRQGKRKNICHSVALEYFEHNVLRPYDVLGHIQEAFDYILEDLCDFNQEIVQNFKNICEEHSIQQLIDNCRQVFQAAKIKFYLMYYASFEISKHESEHSTMMKYFEVAEKRRTDAMSKFKVATLSLPRDVEMCDSDPDYYSEESGFIKLRNVFQGYIVNQLHLLKNRDNCSLQDGEDFCGETNPVLAHENYDSELRNMSRCRGELWDCKKRFYNDNVLKSHSKLTVCLDHRNTDRRYESAYVGNHEHYYVQDRCTMENFVEEEDEPANCSVCYCVCADGSDYKNKTSSMSDRAFSLLPVFSDISNNYVITGAQLLKKFGVVHIRIEQGILLANGSINSTSLDWKEVSDDDLLNPEYHFYLNWKDSRSIQLEDVDLPSGNTLVGLSFYITSFGNINRLRLTAHGSNFNFSSGKLDSSKPLNFWGKNIDLYKEDAIDVHEKLAPLLSSNTVTVTNKFVNFDITDLETDLGQTLIPFIDNRYVSPFVPTLMGGTGLYYKHPGENSKHAGYIGLKLKTYNYNTHI